MNVNKKKVTKYETISDEEFLELFNEVEDRYGEALQELANIESTPGSKNIQR